MSSDRIAELCTLRTRVEPLWRPNAAFGHGFDHAERVFQHSQELARIENADILITGASAYLMDAGLDLINGREDHIARGISLLPQILCGLPTLSQKHQVIEECIRLHEAECPVPTSASKEARVVHDSDTLDRLGSTGVNMTIAYGSWIGRPFCSKNDPMCQNRLPDLRGYTLDYLIYLKDLSKHLVLSSSSQLAAAKTKELAYYLALIELQLKSRLEIDHGDAYRILTELRRVPEWGSEL